MNKKFDELSKRLSKNGFIVNCFENIAEVKKYLLDEISKEDSVAIGGSITIDELSIYKDLKDRNNNVYWHWKSTDKKKELEKAKNAKVYLVSTNALTLDGKLVNIDGTGNRVSSMFYGHEKVYIVVGRNKICANYSEAKKRIENIAAPKNAKRLNLNTPCRHTGKCNDCDSPDRICKVETIIHKNPSDTQIYICIVDEELGY